MLLHKVHAQPNFLTVELASFEVIFQLIDVRDKKNTLGIVRLDRLDDPHRWRFFNLKVVQRFDRATVRIDEGKLRHRDR